MAKILHNIEDALYEQIGLKDKIYMADSFVKRTKKIGSGNGEAKLYVGNEGKTLREFYGNKGFKIRCFLKRDEVISFLEDLKPEYKYPQQQYRNKENLPKLYNERLENVRKQDDLIWFNIVEQDQINPPRIYVKSNEMGFKLLRELSLPELSYLSFLKLKHKENVVFHARLFTDYTPLGNRFHPSSEPKIDFNLKKKQSVTVRVGQADFRKRVIDSCPFCPITRAADDRILQAAHIKPYKESKINEAYDTFNGISLTPTMHSLYDLGFISFNNKSELLLSNWISKVTAMKVGLSAKMKVTIPDFNKRYEYIKFHEKNIFKS